MTASSGAVPGAATPEPRSALIVGCGLIGTSIGLALRAARWDVALADVAPQVTSTAAALGAGQAVPWPPATRDGGAADGYDVVIIAVPPDAVAAVAHAAHDLQLAGTLMHVASVQSRPQIDFERAMGDADRSARLVGTHPMAGSERAGPAAGSASLFRDRPWVLCSDTGDPSSLRVAEAVVTACGGRVVRMRSDEHDAAVAVVSHLPQLVSSALAAQVFRAADAAVAVAGSGLRDVTRLADSDPALWGQIVSANAERVAPAVRELRDSLSALLEGLEAGTAASARVVADLVTAGRAGRERLGGKHGGQRRHWAGVQVVIPDRPGALVDVLSACREVGINVEDLRVEHTPGRPQGMLELLVDPAVTDELAGALRRSWDVVAVVQPHD